MFLRAIRLMPLLLSVMAAAQVASIDLTPYGFRATTNKAYRPEFHVSEVAYLTDGSLVVGFRRAGEVLKKSSEIGRNMMPVRLLRFDAKTGKLLAKADTTVERGAAVSFLESAPDNALLLLGANKFVLLDATLKSVAEYALPPHTLRVDVASGARSFAIGIGDENAEHFQVRSLPQLNELAEFTIPKGAPLVLLRDGYASIGYGNDGYELVIIHDAKEHKAPLRMDDFDCRPTFGALPENHVVIVACHRFWVYDQNAALVMKGDIGTEDDLVAITSSAAASRFALITIEGFAGAPPDQQRVYGESFRAIVFDLTTRTKVQSVKLKPMPKLGGEFALSPDGTTLAALKDGSLAQVALDVPTAKKQ